MRFYSAGHCGFQDREGTTVIEPRYENCEEFSDGLAAVQLDERWGYIDEQGDLAIMAQFATADVFSEGLAFVELNSGEKVVIDTAGNVLFEADYYEHRRFLEGLAAVRPVTHWECWSGEESKEYTGTRPPVDCPANQLWDKDWEWGYIDRTGTMVIPAQYLMARDFHEGLAAERDGFIDHNGNEVIQKSGSDFSEGLAVVDEDEKWGYIDKGGAYVVLPTYEATEAMTNGRGLVRKDGKYGYVDNSGSLVIAAEYDDALQFAEGVAPIKKENKWGYIDRDGKTAIPFQFDSARPFQDGQALVSAGGTIFLIDIDGRRAKTRPPSLAQTFAELQGFEVKLSDRGMPAEGPLDRVAPLMAIYKEQLRELVVRKLKDLAERNVTAAGVKVSLEQELRRAGIRFVEKEKSETRPYGLINEIEVILPASQPKLLVVLFRLNLPTKSMLP
jgi:hypothetical protein